MADYYRMPTLGQSMEEGTIVRWFKQEGDAVREGDVLFEVMSDKANFEVESTMSGVLRRILVGADETVPVNTPIAILGTADEPIDSLVVGPPAAPAAAPEPAAPPALGPPRAPGERLAISPRARRLADERGIPLEALAGIGTGPGGRIQEKDVRAWLERQPAPEPRPRATPLAARIAQDLGVDLGDLALGLPGSRVRAADVLRLASPPAPEPVGQSARQEVPPGPVGEPAVQRVIPFRGLRRLVGDNVARSRQTAPHVTLVVEVDMSAAADALAALRPEVERSHGVKLTYTDLLVKAAARALQDHPLCNAALVGEEIRVYADRNVGVAVAAEQGLLVPVVKTADRKGLGEISAEIKGLVERCRAGRQTQEDLSGGTFTVTNLGAYGIDTFDPILVPPQACILGVGRIAHKPAVADGQIVARPLMSLCLSFDHRVLDGAPAAQFLQRLKQVLEAPLLLAA